MLKAIKLRFSSPVHFGRGREELDKSELVYHSDSMKSALYAVGLSMFPEWKDEKRFHNSFRISSCFPYAENEYFLPRPQLKRKIYFGENNEDNAAKKVKKIEYLEKSVFEDFVNCTDGEILISPDLITPDGLFVCKNKNTFTRKGDKGEQTLLTFYRSEVQQRVSVPKEGDEADSTPFYIDRIYFEENCGLYFLAEFDDAEIEQQVMETLRLLGENGIGTDRAVGNGLFIVETIANEQDFNLQINSRYGSFLSLGLFLPTKEEHASIDFDESAWNLIKRGGYMAGSGNINLMHLRKRSVYMFREGSVLKASIELNGKYEDLQPAWNDEEIHPIWRDGQCLLLKI